MPLPPASPRKHLHSRTVLYRGFLREDGLFDIEAEMRDVKTYDIDRPTGVHRAGVPVHQMQIRVTIDDGLVIRAIASSMDHTPHSECQAGNDPMHQMVGVRLGSGWRETIERVMGRERGCTHVRELLYNLATAAFQTTLGFREQQPKARKITAEPGTPPHHLGGCIAWDFNGPTVARLYPQFAGYQRVKLVAKPPSSDK